MTDEERAIWEDDERRIDYLWRAGFLDWKLRDHQLDIKRRRRAYTGDIFAARMHRQGGKTWELCVDDLADAVTHKDWRILYGTYSLKATRSIVRPTIEEILVDCPRDLRPKFNNVEGEYLFPTGTTITLAGFDDGRAENYRGRKAHKINVDEGGFVARFRYVVKSVLYPMLKTTGGKMNVSSTPPPTPGHEFVDIYYESASRGGAAHKTVYDDPTVTPEDIERFILECGGADSIHFRREYMAEFVIDETRAIVPEFFARKGLIVREPEVPPHFLPIVSMDVGYRDNTAVLFGYYDFRAAKLVIQDEVYLRGATTETIANAVRSKEKELWGNRRVHSRWSDTDPRLIADLSTLHKLVFVPTQKDEKEAQINELRIWTARGKLGVAPWCRLLVNDLETGIWNERRTDYERTKDGHADGIDALVYMLRNAPTTVNPYPEVPDGMSHATHFIPESKQYRQADALAAALTRKGR